MGRIGEVQPFPPPSSKVVGVVNRQANSGLSDRKIGETRHHKAERHKEGRCELDK